MYKIIFLTFTLIFLNFYIFPLQNDYLENINSILLLESNLVSKENCDFILNPSISSIYKFRNNFSVGYGYYFGFLDLNTKSLSYSKNNFTYAYGLAFHTFGSDVYNENRIIFNFSKNFLNKLYLGLNSKNNILNFDNNNYIIGSFDTGITIFPDSTFAFGYVINNIITFGRYQKDLPKSSRLGVSFSYPLFELNISIFQEKKFKAAYKYSILFNLTDYFSIGLAQQSNPSDLGLLLKIIKDKYKFNLGFIYDDTFKNSNFISFDFNF